MRRLTYTLVADGPSDQCLLRIINWTLSQSDCISPETDLVSSFGRFGCRDLADRVLDGFTQFPCDIIFVHRDAEREPREKRLQEIKEAISQCQSIRAYVPVIPIRMTEAWLLIDTNAIRRAADNPNGCVAIDLPSVKKLESVPDPKRELHSLLEAASEKTGRRLDQFKRDLPLRVRRVADYIDDFSPLRRLPAFQKFEADLSRALEALAR